MKPPRSIIILDVFLKDALNRLHAAAQSRDVASVIFTGKQIDARAYIDAATPLVAAAQTLNIAALVTGSPATVQYTSADGLHVNVHGHDESELKAFAGNLKPKFIVGGGDIRNRDDAFAAAEHGLDYILFGNVNAPTGPGNAIAPLAELAKWWVEIAEIPCACLVPTPQDEAAILATKAEFLAYIA